MAKPLCVDLDGTLIKTDTLHELIFHALKKQPWLIVMMALWLLRGRHILKRELTSRFRLNVESLPYSRSFLEFLREQYAAGRAIYLVTGADQRIAQQVIDYLGIFAGCWGSNSERNLTGRKKAALLVEKFGERGFDYAGNDHIDLHVWQQSDQCYLVNGSPSVASRSAKRVKFVSHTEPRENLSLKLLAKTMRLHQWAKNGLVFVPLLASHHFLDLSLVWLTFIGFVAFGCVASFSYIINDFGDLEADRSHHSKYLRPIASGQISIPTALLLAASLLIAAIGLCTLLPKGFVASLIIYFVVTNLYSLRFKAIPMLDVIILAGLYTLRILAGSFTADGALSFWLLAFSAFIFFSLAVVKRIAELLVVMERNQGQRLQVRGYWTTDLPVLLSFGTASAMMAVLVVALYINSPQIMEMYSTPYYLWLVCPVLALWLGRVWLITWRGLMHDDPVVFALKDKHSWLMLGLALALMVAGA